MQLNKINLKLKLISSLMLYHQTLRSIHLNSELVKNQEGLKKLASFILVSIINAKINNI